MADFQFISRIPLNHSFMFLEFLKGQLGQPDLLVADRHHCNSRSPLFWGHLRISISFVIGKGQLEGFWETGNVTFLDLGGILRLCFQNFLENCTLFCAFCCLYDAPYNKIKI